MAKKTTKVVDKKTSTELAAPASSTAVAITNPWSVVPSLGNLDAYITAVNNLPMLTEEEEKRFAKAYTEQNDLQSAGKLVLSHLRLVVSVSRQYLGYGLPHADLIQEGNVGLMKAVKRFDPTQGVRLVSYAMHWIKAEIHEFILKNWRMVKVATTKGQRKLFFNLRSLKNTLKEENGTEGSHYDTLTEQEVQTMAKRLNVKPEEVREMETRLSGGEVAMESPVDSTEESYAPIAYLVDEQNEPTAVLQQREHEELLTEGIGQALEKLDERSRRIVEERWLKVNDDGSGGMTLQELAKEYGVSAERIRQIESAAMKKMRTALQNQY